MSALPGTRRPAVAVALVALLPWFAGCSDAQRASTPVKAATADATTPPDTVVLDAAAEKRAGIEVSTVTPVTRPDLVTAPGLVALNEAQTARVGSLIEGVVVDVLVQPGTKVRAQQLLATMHSHLVHEAWAGYRKAKADERRLITELRYATEAEARAQRLYADKAVALQDVQRAQANRVSAEESLDMGRTEIRRAEEELEHLGVTNGEDPTGEQGERVPVRTPFSGIVLERLVTQGTAVTPGSPLFVVSDLSTLWVLAEVDEAHLAAARTGRAATVRVAAYPGEAFPATVTYIGESVNAKTRRVTIRCETPNPDGRLKPEMYATVELGESEPHPVISIPAGAVQSVSGRMVAFIAEGSGRFRARTVEPGAERDGQIEIRKGLDAGDTVVISGAFVLKSELMKPASDAGE